MLVAVQGRGDLAVVDPAAMTVSRRIALPGCDHPHGLALDPAAGVECDGNATLLSVDITTGRVSGTNPVGDGPDVLAYDAALCRRREWRGHRSGSPTRQTYGHRVGASGRRGTRRGDRPGHPTQLLPRSVGVRRTPGTARTGSRTIIATAPGQAEHPDSPEPGVRSVSELVPNRPSMAIDQLSRKRPTYNSRWHPRQSTCFAR